MRTRIVALFLCILTLGLFFLPQSLALAEDDNEFDTGVITGKNVALRKSASSKSDVVSRLALGTTVEIVGTNVNAEWHKVKAGGKTGYVNRMYVNIEPSLEAYQGEYTGKIVNCKTEVNVRTEPKKSAPQTGVAKKGETFTVTEEHPASGWRGIEFNGRTAYVASQYLELIPKVTDKQLSSLTVEGGTLYPNFGPGEHGYVLVADDEGEITISADANSGVKVDVDKTGTKSNSFTLPASGSRTVRIRVDGRIRYTVYVVRNALIVGTWNIKRGNDGNLPLMGRLIETQVPDIMGIQEVYQNNRSAEIEDNLLSLRNRRLQSYAFTPTINYDSGGKYGVGILSRYDIISSESFPLTSADKEPRVLQKVVIEVDGKKVSFYNTHYSYESSTIRKKQFSETLAILEKDTNKYKILVGDFNAQATEFAKIKGYDVINNTDTKFYDYDGSTVKKTMIDNIVISKSFTKLNIRMIDSALSDHKPIFAFLRMDED